MHQPPPHDSILPPMSLACVTASKDLPYTVVRHTLFFCVNMPLFNLVSPVVHKSPNELSSVGSQAVLVEPDYSWCLYHSDFHTC
jgi:hypothetical protein